MRKRLWFWLYFIVAILLAIYFATRIIMTGLGTSKTSIIRNIYITADIPNKDLSAIASAVALPPGVDSYSINLNELNEKVNEVPGVKASAVRRKPDGNLAIKVKLYRAVALWTDGQQYFPLSVEGTIVNKPVTQRSEADIVFIGAVPKDISQITKVAHNMIGDIDYLEWIENRRWNIHTKNGITVLLPEKDPYSAIGNLIIMNKNYNILSKDLEIIDMRDDSRILVK